MTVIAPRDAAARSSSVLHRGARLLARSVRAHPWPFAAAVLGSALYATTTVAWAVVLGKVTDRVVLPALGEGVPAAEAWRAAAAVVGVAALRTVGVLLRRYCGAMTTRRAQRARLTELVDAYLRAPPAWFGRHPTGRLLAHADTDVGRAVSAIQPLPFALGVGVLVATSIASLATVDPVLMLVGLALFPTLVLLNRRYTVRVEAPAALSQSRAGEVSTVAHESFDGALVVKTLGLEHSEVDRLSAVAGHLRSARTRVGDLRATFEPARDALTGLGTIAMLSLGAWRISAGAVTTGELVHAMTLFGVLALPVRSVGHLLEELPRAVVADDRITTVVAGAGGPDAPAHGPACRPAYRSAPPAPPERAGPPEEVGALEVRVEGLRFGYRTGTTVLEGVDLHLAPGEVVALVGPTGAGKSTLCHLLAGLEQPDAGTIALGRAGTGWAEPTGLRRGVALAFQEAFLFGTTVRDNLTLGEPAGEDELYRALARAGARAFVGRLPDGLDQRIGERGVTLSGGQRQRLALARALLHRPGLLLLDDAIAALDPVTARHVVEQLRRTPRATTLVVARRPSAIGLADRVLYLDAGRIAAAGRHDELVASVPAYASLTSGRAQRPR